MITAADLHNAADAIPLGDDARAAYRELGLDDDALATFVHEAIFGTEYGAPVELDPVSLAYGAAVGVQAARKDDAAASAKLIAEIRGAITAAATGGDSAEGALRSIEEALSA